jgi:hypothetical protein
MKELTQEQLEKAVGGLRSKTTNEQLQSASATGSKASGGGHVRPL